MGHIIWQFVKWFVIGVVAILAVLGLGSEGLLFFGLLVLIFIAAAIVVLIVLHFYEKKKYEPDPEFSNKSKWDDGTEVLHECKDGKDRLFINGKEVLTQKEDKERTEEIDRFGRVLLLGLFGMGAVVAAIIFFS